MTTLPDFPLGPVTKIAMHTSLFSATDSQDLLGCSGAGWSGCLAHRGNRSKPSVRQCAYPAPLQTPPPTYLFGGFFDGDWLCMLYAVSITAGTGAKRLAKCCADAEPCALTALMSGLEIGNEPDLIYSTQDQSTNSGFAFGGVDVTYYDARS